MLIPIGDVKGQARQSGILSEGLKLLVSEFQKPIGEVHRRNRVDEYRRVAGA